jgi:peptidyl-dipeptidase Dcp
MSKGENDDNKKQTRSDFAAEGLKEKLLGFLLAHWNLSNKMHKTPERTMELMMSVWEPVAQVQRCCSHAKIVDSEGGNRLGIIVIIRRKFEREIRSDQNVKEYLNWKT